MAVHFGPAHLTEIANGNCIERQIFHFEGAFVIQSSNHTELEVLFCWYQESVVEASFDCTPRLKLATYSKVVKGLA
jgi:hypothetical protein